MALTDNLVEFWTLNNTRVGAVAGTVLTSADGNDHYCDPGKIGQGWQTTSAGQRLEGVGHNCKPIGGAFTLSAWLSIGSVTSCQGVRFERSSFGDYFAITKVRLSMPIRYRWRILMFVGGNLTYVDFVSTGGWEHFVWKQNADGSADVWKDGVKTPVTMQTWSTTDDLTLKILDGVGAADAIGFWAVGLSDEEILEIYNGGAGWEYAPADNTPDAFAFSAVTNADPSTVYTSDTQTITGMDAGTAISITGGEYRLDGGAWTAAAGTIDPGQTLELRGTSSAESEGVVTVTVTVGSAAVDWTITTKLIASVVTTILWGSTPDTSRILSSRIVRGAL